MNFEWLFSTPTAHRGLHDATTPENSLPSFQKAIDKGLNIEIDVHSTSDGHIVVFHDDTLLRMCGVEKNVRDCTLAEIKSYKLKDTDCDILSMQEFLQLVNGKAGILCEIKGLSPWNLRITKVLLAEMKDYKGNFAIQSFNFFAVSYYRKHSNVPCGQLASWQLPGDKIVRHPILNFMGRMWVTKISRPHFMAYDIRSMHPCLGENKPYHKIIKKIPFLMWTIKDEETVERGLKFANGLIFEKIDADYVLSKYNERLPLKDYNIIP